MKNQLISEHRAGKRQNIMVRVFVFGISLVILTGLLSFLPFVEEIGQNSVLAQDGKRAELAKLAHKILTDPEPYLLDLQYALQNEDAGLDEYYSTRDCVTAGGDCYGGFSFFRFHLYGQTMRTGYGKTCVTTVWPDYKDLDPVRDFTDNDLVRRWRLWQRRAANGEKDAVTKVGIVKTVGLWAIITHQDFDPVAHLREVPRPKHYDVKEKEYFENFKLLEDRTYLVEFSVPKTPLYDELSSIGIEAPDPSSDDVKLRGYYIKGDGVGDHRPLVVYFTGIGAVTKYSGTVRIPYFVAAGYDFLIVDKRGHGWSTGFSEIIGSDVFSLLDQLENGVKSYGPDDNLNGKPVRRKDLLGAPKYPLGASPYTAKTKPILLMGHSLGSLIVMRAMAMNYSDDMIEESLTASADSAAIDNNARGYNFKGIIDIVGFSGSHKYVTEPMLALSSGFWVDDLHSYSMAPSSVYKSMDKWPAYFALKPSLDYSPPQGVIDTCNEKLRGFKKVVMVEGGHSSWTVEPFHSYCMQQIITWASDVVLANEVPSNNRAHTTLRRELRDMPDPMRDERLVEAERWIKRMMKKFKTGK